MRFVFRIFFVVVTLILLAFLILPFIIGYTIQKNINQTLDTLNKRQSPYVTLSLQQFNRHWFYSDAQIKLSVHLPNLSQLNNDYTFDAIIKHGPLFVISQNNTRQLFFNKGAIVIYGNSEDFKGVAADIFDWRDRFSSFVNVPLLKLTNMNGVNVTIQNLQGYSQEKPNHKIVTTLSTDSIQASLSQNNSLPFTLNINKLTTTTKGEFQNFIWFGTHSTSIDEIDVSLNSNGITKKVGILQNVSLGLSNTLTSDASKLNAEAATNIQSLTITDKTIQPFTLSYSLNNVDVAGYAALIQAANQLQAQPAVTDKIIQAGINIAKKGFTLKLNKLLVGLPQSIASSSILASGEITLAPNDQLQMSPTLKNDAEALITADAQLSFPQSLVKQLLTLRYSKMLIQLAVDGKKSSMTSEQLTEEAYNYLLNNSMFAANPDGSVQTRIAFSKGTLLINGHAPAFDLPAPPLEKSATSTDEGELEN